MKEPSLEKQREFWRSIAPDLRRISRRLKRLKAELNSTAARVEALGKQ